MTEPKFSHGQKIRITCTFYRGKVGIVKDCFVRGFINKRWVYLFDGGLESLKLKIEEQNLEAVE